MAETCAHCGTSFGSAADLIAHVRKTHPDPDPRESLAMNPESRRPGLVCALCGHRFGSAEALARHALSPHATANEPARRTPRRHPYLAEPR